MRLFFSFFFTHMLDIGTVELGERPVGYILAFNLTFYNLIPIFRMKTLVVDIETEYLKTPPFPPPHLWTTHQNVQDPIKNAISDVTVETLKTSFPDIRAA